MEHTEWLYQPTREIKNLKDLEFEKQRLHLHQKFLGELLRRDKSILKESLSPKNLVNTALFSVFGNGKSKTDNGIAQGVFNKTPYGKVIQIIQWIFKKII